MPAQRGKPATPKQRAAGKANLERGRAARDSMREEAKDSGELLGPDRWAALLDGTLTVRDLDDKEVKKMRVRGRDGSFAGRARALPSHLVQQFVAEQTRRMKESMLNATPDIIKAMIKLANDEDEPAAVRAALGRYFIDRALGKTPETVRLEGVSGFDAMLHDALGVDRGDLEAEARAAGLKD